MTAKTVKHKFVNPQSDGVDATVTRPSNWNDEHDFWWGYRSVTGTTDTVIQADHLSVVAYTNAGGCTVALPAPSGGNFALGWKTKLINLGTGTVSITLANPPTVNGAATTITLATNEAAEIIGTGTNDYKAIFTRAPTAIPPVIRTDINQTTLTTADQAMALRNIGAISENTYLINGKIVETHASNQSTIAIKTLSGSDPSSTNPVGVFFPDASIMWLTAALSIVIPNGSGSNYPMGYMLGNNFRVWVAIMNDAGTARLLVRNCLLSTTPGTSNTQPWGVEGFDASGKTTASSGPGYANGVTYANSSVATARPYQVIGFIDYPSFVNTSAFNLAPDNICLVGPSTPLPGQLIGSFEVGNVSQSTVTSGTFGNTGLTFGIVAKSDKSLQRITADMSIETVCTTAPIFMHSRILNSTQGSVQVQGYHGYCPVNGDVQIETAALSTNLSRYVGSNIFVVQIALEGGGTGSVIGCFNGNGRMNWQEIQA